MYRSATLPRNDRQLVFTSSQAARYLGVSLATIRRWTDAHHISCYRTPGGQRRFTRDQLDSFITSMHRDGSTDPPPAAPSQPAVNGAAGEVAARRAAKVA
jgi:excisionase family DNA binding protein